MTVAIFTFVVWYWDFRPINCTFFHFSHYLNFFSLRIHLELMLDSRYVLLGVLKMFNFLRHKILETSAEN